MNPHDSCLDHWADNKIKMSRGPDPRTVWTPNIITLKAINNHLTTTVWRFYQNLAGVFHYIRSNIYIWYNESSTLFTTQIWPLYDRNENAWRLLSFSGRVVCLFVCKFVKFSGRVEREKLAIVAAWSVSLGNNFKYRCKLGIGFMRVSSCKHPERW